MIDYSRIIKEDLNKDWCALAEGIEKEIFDETLKYAIKRVSQNLEPFTNKFPSSGGVNGIYQPCNNTDKFLYSDWTSSFWTGMVWLSYELTKDEKFKEIGDIHLKSFRKRLDENDDLNHHDIGFLYILSCVAAYKAIGSEFAKETALLAAKKLSERFNEVAGVIQVRGNVNSPDPNNGTFIVDCSLNIPLLYWASDMTGDEKYRIMAKRHIKNVANYMVRDNAATHQSFTISTETAEPLGGSTPQGDGSLDGCWSRGQAWAIYGLPISYTYTGEASLLEVCKRTVNYFLNRLQSDNVPNWDFLYKTDDDQRDTSASAIAVCGMLELAKNLPLYDPDRKVYEAAAKVLTHSLIKNYLYSENEDSNALIKSGVYAFKTNLCVNEPTIWGDYFFMESLVRLTQYFRMYW